jgi:hypothetical protein
MDVAKLDYLNGRLAAGRWSRSWGFGRWEGYRIWCDGRIRAKAKESDAEQFGCVRGDCHGPQVMCNNRPFQGNGPCTDIVVFSLEIRKLIYDQMEFL